MPYTPTEITTYIARAQRALADYMLKAVRLEANGEDATYYYNLSEYLSDGTRVLNYTNSDLTPDQKEAIIHCMIEKGKLNDYSGATLTFPTITVVYPPSLAAELSTLSDGPGGGTGTLVGNEYRHPSVNFDGSAWEYKKAGFQGTVLFVSPSGVSGKTEKGNIVYHYQTIQAAESDAITGDTIVVMPGAYSANGLGKDGVTYYFMPGVTNSSSLNMFNLSAAMTVVVRGEGVFTITASSATLAVFAVSHASAVLDAQFKEINTSTTASTPVNQSAGSVKLKGKIKSNYNNAAGHCILKSGTSTLILDDVLMITTHAGAVDISASSAQSVLVHRAKTNVLTKDTDITEVINSIERDANYA